MITSKTLGFILLMFQLIASCEVPKESIKDYKKLIVGKWTGTYKDGESTKIAIYLTFLSDGKLILDYTPSKGKKFELSYKIVDDVVECDFFLDGLKISKLNVTDLKFYAQKSEESEQSSGFSSIDAIYFCEFKKVIELNAEPKFLEKPQANRRAELGRSDKFQRQFRQNDQDASQRFAR